MQAERSVQTRAAAAAVRPPEAAEATAATGETSIEERLGQPLAAHPRLRRGQLANGLRYVILPNPVPPNRFEAHLEVLPHPHPPSLVTCRVSRPSAQPSALDPRSTAPMPPARYGEPSLWRDACARGTLRKTAGGHK
jgi:hypothetical protein